LFASALALYRAPCFPFYSPRRWHGLHERERERERERREDQDEKNSWGRVVLHLPYAGPADPAVDDGNGSTS